jgi:hypothetical protein
MYTKECNGRNLENVKEEHKSTAVIRNVYVTERKNMKKKRTGVIYTYGVPEDSNPVKSEIPNKEHKYGRMRLAIPRFMFCS